MKIIVGVSGASGIVLARRLLQILKEKNIDRHLIVSGAAREIAKHELGGLDLGRLASRSYDEKDFSAAISSGSFKMDGMVIIPCSMRTLGGIANGIAHNLIVRAAEVMLKQDKKLVLVPREAPLDLIHLRNMVACREAGCVIIPPVLAFYPKPESVTDMVDFVVGKVLDSLGIENSLYKRWGEE